MSSQPRRGVSAEAPDTSEPPLLDVRDLTCRFGGLLALNRVSFSVRQGEI